ncbi:MAG: dipeptide epimerase [Pirellulales bacterium]
MKMTLHRFDLALRHAFTIARGTTHVQRTLVVELSDGVHSGYGEAPETDYYGATIEAITAALDSARAKIEAIEPSEDGTITWPADFWQAMQPDLASQPFAQCALDQAAHDLWGKRLGQPVYRLWGLLPEHRPPTDYTIGIDELDKMIAKLREMPDFPVYKIKLGTPHDVEIVRQLRQHTDAIFRVDANCGWSADEAIEKSRQLAELNVQFIEQPLPPEDTDGMRRVYAETSLPVIADESCIAEPDVAKCAEYFHGVNVKLVKCGGMTPARRMIDEARSLGLRTMVGCMTESTVGISAIAQLLPLLDYVDMDGPLLLAEDVASGVRIERGIVHYAQENGNGVRLL